MARSRHTPEQRSSIITEARRLMKEGTKFQAISSTVGVRPDLLRCWLNRQTRDWLYPKMENQGRIR